MLHLAHIHEQKKNRIIQRNATQRNATKRSDIEMVVTNQPNPLSRPAPSMPTDESSSEKEDDEL